MFEGKFSRVRVKTFKNLFMDSMVGPWLGGEKERHEWQWGNAAWTLGIEL